MDFPFAMMGYGLDLSHGLSADTYLLKQVATLCEVVARGKSLIAQSKFAALFVISSVAWPESG